MGGRTLFFLFSVTIALVALLWRVRKATNVLEHLFLRLHHTMLIFYIQFIPIISRHGIYRRMENGLT